MAKLLVVDDEVKIRDMIFKYAQHSGHDVILAVDGDDALKKFKKDKFDVVIMDIMMPKMDGYQTLNKMKEIDSDVHCIFLTALGQEYDRVYGLDIGAEDYITKPFSLKELMLRINVILKRNNKDKTKSRINYRGIVIDSGSRIITVDDNVVDFAKKEYELLELLIKNQGRVVSREKIFSNIWGYEYESDDRTIDTHIKLIRKKIGKYENYLTTVRGVGYRFEEEN